MSTRKFRIATLDVWGNAEDGFDVNDVHMTADSIELEEHDGGPEIITKLIAAGYIDADKCHLARVEWVGDDMWAVDEAESGKPVYQLHARD